MFLCFAILTHSAQAANHSLYLQAESAIAKQNWSFLEQHRRTLMQHPLYPYLRKKELLTHESVQTLDNITAFEQRYADFPSKDEPRKAWLQKRAKQREWRAFLKGYIPTNDVGLVCTQIYADYQVHHQLAVLDKTKDLWKVGRPQPAACDPLFALWESIYPISRELAWERIEAALRNREFKLALHLLQYVPRRDHHSIKSWVTVQTHPERLTQEQWHFTQDPKSLQGVWAGLQKLLQKDTEKGERTWAWMRARYPEMKRLEPQYKRELAIQYARQHDPRANQLFNNFQPAKDDVLGHEWKIRSALRWQDWKSAQRALQKLPPALAETPRWQYWLGRTQEALGDEQAAHAQFKKVAQTASFYGLLSKFRLNPLYEVKPAALPDRQKWFGWLAKQPSMDRVEALMDLGRTTLAKEEWQYFLKNLNEDAAHAAGHYAITKQWPNLAMQTPLRSHHPHAIAYRFPLIHRSEVQHAAQRHDLDPAWVFAIARQESAFNPGLTSPKGAMGLLQVLPSTAKEVARRLKIPYSHAQQLFQPKTNLSIGSAYLQRLYLDFKLHPVLATAAYNAGPARVKSWLPYKKMPADIWIETMPYAETRDYVSNVLSFTTMYRAQLGHNTALLTHLEDINSGY